MSQTGSRQTGSRQTGSRQTLVVVNPSAGGGRAGRIWQALRKTTPELAAAETLQATDAATSRHQLAAALQRGAGRVLAVGGDGTAHLVINTLLEEAVGDTVAFGLVPAGTGSDLARSLGLASRPAAALRQVLTAEPRTIDALQVTVAGSDGDAGPSCYVVNIASAGLSGAVVPAVNANPNRGRLAYLTSTLAALWRYRPVPCRIEVDGETFSDGGFFLAAFANGQYFGKGMRVAPDARLDDGWINVVVIPPVPLWHLPYRMPQFLTGRHVTLPFVKTTQARHVRLSPAVGFPPLDVDGESLPAGPAEVRVLPGALRVLAPPRAKHRGQKNQGRT